MGGAWFFPIFLAVLGLLPVTESRASDAFGYIGNAARLPSGTTIVDARPEQACLRRTVRGARCLPAADFLGPHGRLASFREIYWLLGTAGLSEKAPVLVVGDDPSGRDFVAGMLYLCGQFRVSILTVPVSAGAGLSQDQMGQGIGRGMTRHPIYQGAVRENRIVLRGELAQELAAAHPPLVLDGRNEDEYWGERIRAMRGGHLPGAQSLPMVKVRAQIASGIVQIPPRGGLVAYGDSPFESVAYFTLLRAGAGADARVLPDGWSDWANHPGLPLDSVAYPDAFPAHVARLPDGRTDSDLLAFFAILAVLSAGFFYLGKRSR
ncbi:MAG: rhodanese-like domain-containing protein [Sulfuricellaceae bacterium]|nr:rhodanese-like domain-containing protein [Sulfuricellaceae bacterium]